MGDYVPPDADPEAGPDPFDYQPPDAPAADAGGDTPAPAEDAPAPDATPSDPGDPPLSEPIAAPVFTDEHDHDEFGNQIPGTAKTLHPAVHPADEHDHDEFGNQIVGSAAVFHDPLPIGETDPFGGDEHDHDEFGNQIAGTAATLHPAVHPDDGLERDEMGNQVLPQ